MDFFYYLDATMHCTQLRWVWSSYQRHLHPNSAVWANKNTVTPQSTTIMKKYIHYSNATGISTKSIKCLLNKMFTGLHIDNVLTLPSGVYRTAHWQCAPDWPAPSVLHHPGKAVGVCIRQSPAASTHRTYNVTQFWCKQETDTTFIWITELKGR